MKIAKAIVAASLFLTSAASLAAPSGLAYGAKSAVQNASTNVCTVREISIDGELYVWVQCIYYESGRI